jgi:hypothetical protein
MEWHRANKKKDRTIPLARNMMKSVLWDVEGWILVDFLTRK